MLRLSAMSQDVYVFENVLQSGVAGPGDVVAFFIHVSSKGLPQVQHHELLMFCLMAGVVKSVSVWLFPCEASHPMLRLRCFVDGAYALLPGLKASGSLCLGL